MRFSDNLQHAITDYFILLEKGYPKKRTLELVADKHQLNQIERSVLYRGVDKMDISTVRRNKIINELLEEDTHLKVDFLNQIYSIIGYLEGKLVYISSDGYLRDACEFHGSTINFKNLNRAIQMLAYYFKEYPNIMLEFLVDEQVNNASRIVKETEIIIKRENLQFSIIKSDNVDKLIESSASFFISTSDSKIIERTQVKVFDLAKAVLEKNFLLNIPDISSILSKLN